MGAESAFYGGFVSSYEVWKFIAGNKIYNHSEMLLSYRRLERSNPIDLNRTFKRFTIICQFIAKPWAGVILINSILLISGKFPIFKAKAICYKRQTTEFCCFRIPVVRQLLVRDYVTRWISSEICFSFLMRHIFTPVCIKISKMCSSHITTFS